MGEVGAFDGLPREIGETKTQVSEIEKRISKLEDSVEKIRDNIKQIEKSQSTILEKLNALETLHSDMSYVKNSISEFNGYKSGLLFGVSIVKWVGGVVCAALGSVGTYLIQRVL